MKDLYSQSVYSNVSVLELVYICDENGLLKRSALFDLELMIVVLTSLQPFLLYHLHSQCLIETTNEIHRYYSKQMYKLMVEHLGCR